jgi:uncharacterized membrane protein
MKIKTITYFGIGIALYVVLGCFINIPLLVGSHLQTDLGYVVFGVYCYLFGPGAFIIGVLGCLIESLLTSGWVPVGWMAGQAVIGLLCGKAYTMTEKKTVHIAVTVIAVFLGIGVMKTVIECAMYGIPVFVKFPKNIVAFIADVIPMILGLMLGHVFTTRIKKADGG